MLLRALARFRALSRSGARHVLSFARGASFRSGAACPLVPPSRFVAFAGTARRFATAERAGQVAAGQTRAWARTSRRGAAARIDARMAC